MAPLDGSAFLPPGEKYNFFPIDLTKEKQGIYYLLEIRLYEFY